MHIRPSTPRLLTILTLGLTSILAAATPLPAPALVGPGNGSSGLCGVAALLCCHTVEPATSPAARTLLAAVGAAVQDAATPGPVGIACAPIEAGGACSANAVCCAGEFGLLGIGCLPALV